MNFLLVTISIFWFSLVTPVHSQTKIFNQTRFQLLHDLKDEKGRPAQLKRFEIGFSKEYSGGKITIRVPMGQLSRWEKPDEEKYYRFVTKESGDILNSLPKGGYWIWYRAVNIWENNSLWTMRGQKVEWTKEDKPIAKDAFFILKDKRLIFDIREEEIIPVEKQK